MTVKDLPRIYHGEINDKHFEQINYQLRPNRSCEGEELLLLDLHY